MTLCVEVQSTVGETIAEVIALGKAGAVTTRIHTEAARVGRHKTVGAGEGDFFDGNTNVSAATFADDKVRVGNVETTFREGEIGGRASLVDAEVGVFGDRVTLGATGPNADAEAGFVSRKDMELYKLGAGAGLGGVSAQGKLGDERNGVEGSLGVGLGVGFGLDLSRTKNDDGTTTTKFGVDLALLGKVAFGGSITTEPSAGPKGRNLRAQQLAAQRKAAEGGS